VATGVRQVERTGTASLVLNAAGDTVVAESRHYPYGEERWRWAAGGGTTLPTDYRFTGQRVEGRLGGIYQMGARFYDPGLGRWLSADTIVPEPGNPQALNRYSYVKNRPLCVA
jgi:RHS repeat-associated protein